LLESSEYLRVARFDILLSVALALVAECHVTNSNEQAMRKESANARIQKEETH
jgi:hypothetical protein